ncbi:MAG: T9SS type A sorting domain-containing protein [Flavipsychrobacter sp.]|nr:T9SS type A sorting domain-containing protein [Flavipsychrobacter sp.]
MKPKFILFAFTLLTSPISLFAQSPFPTIDSVDINNIKAAQLVHGDMWWNPVQQVASCEFPKGSGKSISLASSLWMSGYDGSGGLHIAAQTYRQNGNDYWPGPLDSTGKLSYTTSQMWAKIWKVNRTQINTFKSLSTHTVTNTPAPILEWPAKGNPYATGNGGVALTISTDMAPFVDVNNDGIYNPLSGDYPAIKGDQTLWWTFSDNGPTHTETKGQPIKAEVHAMAYAYSRGTLADNMIFYEYNVINKSGTDYNNFRVGQFADMDLGYFGDDYVGFDSTHRMGIIYNGDTVDGSGQTNAYGNMIPTAALTMLTLPGDASSSFAPAGSFIDYHNDFTPRGNPSSPGEYNNYLRSLWRDSTHLKNDFSGYGIPSNAYGPSYPDCNYEFTGDPLDTAKWSECACSNMPGDRRFVIASNDFTLAAGSSQKVALALITTNPILDNGCSVTNFSTIKQYADSAWYIYQHPYPAAGVPTMPQSFSLHIYPNPAHDKLLIDNLRASTNMIVYNMLGQVMRIPISNSGSVTQIDISLLPAGIYNVVYSIEGTCGNARFIKE